LHGIFSAVSFQKRPKKRIEKTKNMWIVFLKPVFVNTVYLSIVFFCDFLLIARSGTSHVTISLVGGAPHA